MPAPRSYVSGGFALELDGIPAGRLKSASGGEASADVVIEPPGPSGIVGKHLGSLHHAPIEIAVECVIERPLLTWIQEFLDRKAPRRSGAISMVDYQHKEVSSRRFRRALLAEVAFPAFDAASKESAAVMVRMGPESTEVIPGSGAVVGAPAARTARWLAANFRLTIAGLDCTRVSKIAPLTVRQAARREPGGMPGSAPARPAALEVADLVVTVAEPHAQTWSAWYQDFVVNGNSDAAHEKSGTLELLAPNETDVLLTLELSGLGIHSLVADAQPPGGEAIRRVRASIYCEQVASKTPA